jgi:antitoxin ParD1/3/4
MRVRPTLNISIPDQMRQWIDAKVGSGHYANASDFVRDLIRHDQREKEDVEIALIAGQKSGISRRRISDIARDTRQQGLRSHRFKSDPRLAVNLA